MACSLPLPPVDMTRKSVLIVGEDDLIAWAIRKRCSAMQVPVRTVRTPEEALSALREGSFGLVLFDPGILEGIDPAVAGAFHGAPGAGRSAPVPGEEGTPPPGTDLPLSGTRFMEKPMNVFDLERAVEGLVGRFSEKRTESRYSCNIPVSIFLEEETRGGEISAWGHPTGVAAEASESGLRVYTSHRLDPGQRLRLSALSVQNPQARFIRRDRVAVVVWVVPDEEGIIAGLRYLE